MTRAGGLCLAVWICGWGLAWGGSPDRRSAIEGAPSLASIVSSNVASEPDSARLPATAITGAPGAPTAGTLANPSAAGGNGAADRWPNPTVTLLKSMAVPGWGQITNRRYVKAAVAIGLETWFIAGAITEWRRSNDALDLFRAEPANLEHYYDYAFHNGNKNDYLWALGVTVFVSMFDAYVDAHLRPYTRNRIPEVTPPPGVALVVASF